MYCEHEYFAKEDVSNFCESLVIRQISPSKVNDVHYEESKPTKFYLVKVSDGNFTSAKHSCYTVYDLNKELNNYFN